MKFSKYLDLVEALRNIKENRTSGLMKRRIAYNDIISWLL